MKVCLCMCWRGGGKYICEGMFVYVLVGGGGGSICVRVCLCMCWRGWGKYMCEGVFVYVLVRWGGGGDKSMCARPFPSTQGCSRQLISRSFPV